MAMTAAFFISPKGEIIHSQSTHIDTVIRYPKKFGLNKDMIEFIYNQYNEKIGQEGKAREQILTYLFNAGWIRLRRYKQFWTANVKKLTDKVKTYLQKFAQNLIQGKLPFRDFEGEYADIRIVQNTGKVVNSNLKSLAQSTDFVTESYNRFEVEFKNIEDLEDRPLIPEAKKIMEKIRGEKLNG